MLDELQVAGDREPNNEGVLRIRDQEGDLIQAGLQNLAQLVADEPLEDWHRHVVDHFANIVKPPQLPVDGTAALRSLRVRFWPPEYFQQADAIYRILAPGLFLGLVLDLPTSIASIKPEQLTQWNLSESEAWSAAEKNTINEPVEVVSEPGPKGTTITFLLADNFYVSSHALWLDRHLTVDPERGALVGLPTRHLVVAHAIEDLRVLPVVGMMLASNQQVYQQGPGSITPGLYWWRKGTFVEIPSVQKDGQPAITPPDSFVALLNSLAPTP